MNLHSACPACSDTTTELFYSAHGVPSNACVLCFSREEALALPKGDIDLHICRSCGFIFNVSFDVGISEYSDRYEATQGFSPTFSGFQKRLGKDLIERHDLSGKRIMEIGCGHGEFLVLLSQLGECEGLGIDPSADPNRIRNLDGAERVKLFTELYQDKHSSQPADLLVCKMTLEHIPNVKRFLAQIRRNLEKYPNTVVFFQVPESSRILREAAFHDIYYEHCSYFTPSSIGRAFLAEGFEVLNIATQYDDQYLILEAKPAMTNTEMLLPVLDDLEVTLSDASTFQTRVNLLTEEWRAKLSQYSDTQQKIVLWGSGAKAVAFLSILNMNDSISHIVDINPNKSNSFTPVTGQPIILPGELVKIQPDLVVVMNGIYETEIRKDLTSLGLSPKIMCL